ncbi:kinase [Magnetofaba australis]|uniref:Putative GHMP kinase n=1 Tax=Magnetofaba australis IT-1 TaxID=1434232 RepID=A0A1Y2K6P3_9PROT|nr:kinase [Magnetofaba australis]OSM05210.1 putative GHMP kinase [Magnetofaba australis IT-1]
MIITRTPFRVSFFGGGTDYPPWFKEHGGAVLALAINKYCYLTVRRLPPFFEHKHRIVYSKVELVKELSEIQHPVVRGVMQEHGVNCGLEIHHDADLPARSGLGSSSSFTVGFLSAIHALNGRMVTKAQLAQEAIHIEQNVLKENVGCQDQITAALGGFNKISFLRDGSFQVDPMILSGERMQEMEGSLMLFFTGITRFASDVAGKKIANLGKKEKQLKRMYKMVDESIDILTDIKQPIDHFGQLMHESWKLKRELSDSVTNERIDEIYNAAMDAGASGGKLMGAGSGGFMVFCVRPALQKRVRERLNKLIHVDTRIDHTGSQVMVYDPDTAIHFQNGDQ